MNAKTKGSPFKWLGAMVMSLLMVLACLPTIALADTTYTISLKDGDTHIYSVYQIFTGDLDTDGTTLSKVKWGQNGTGTVGDKVPDTVLAELQGVNTSTATDTEKLAVINKYVSTTGNAYGTVDKDNQLENVPAGYYLLKDKDSLVGKQDASTLFIVEVVNNVQVNRKSDVPTVEKKVDDKDDSTNLEDEINWQDSADWDTTDSIPYQLTGTLPSNYADYKGYYYEFVDTLSKGLKLANGFDESSVTVKLVNIVTNADGTPQYETDGTTIKTAETEITSGYTVSTSHVTDGTYAGGTQLKVTFSNLKNITGVTSTSKIVVTYNATLDADDAVIGSAGNPNEVKLVFSNNPNTAEGGGTDEKGETKPDKVIVFTYDTVVNKVDENGDPLAGANFTLYKYDAAQGKYVEVEGKLTVSNSSQDNPKNDVFTFSGLDAGKYKLVESTTPNGYNTMEDLEFTIEATHDVEKDDPQLETLVVKNANGTTVSSETDKAAQFTVTMEKTATEGVIETDVVNQKGATLPSTGGMGTTLLYAVGGALVVVAAGILIYKKVRPQEA